MNITDRHIDEAIEWHVRLAADDADWSAFVDWLEADEGNRQAYDLIAVRDQQIMAHIDVVAPTLPANDDDVPQAGRGIRWGMGIAASLAVLGMTTFMWTSMQGVDPITYQTAAGEQRTIALADGASIQMAANSRLTVNTDDVARINLVSGGAYFVAPSDPDASFDIQAGSYRVRDVGTRFTLTRNAGIVSVVIADGIVSVQPDGAAGVRLRAGQGLQIDEKDQRTQLYTVVPAHIASWRTGRLVYDSTPFATVVADIERTTGLSMTIDRSLASKGFSGVLEIGNGSRLVTDFAQIAGLQTETRAHAIHFVAAD